jgi:hypothetical protein
VDNARGNQVKLKNLSADGDGMSGVIAATKSGNVVCAGGKKVSYMTFALISPLGTEYDV